MPPLLSLLAPQVIKMTTWGTTSFDKVGIMITLWFQWNTHDRHIPAQLWVPIYWVFYVCSKYGLCFTFTIDVLQWNLLTAWSIIMCITYIHIVWWLQVQHTDQTKNSQKAHHSSPSRVSYGVSFVSVWRKIVSQSSSTVGAIEGLMPDCSNSSALALELLQACTKPSLYWIVLQLTQVKLDGLTGPVGWFQS